MGWRFFDIRYGRANRLQFLLAMVLLPSLFIYWLIDVGKNERFEQLVTYEWVIGAFLIYMWLVFAVRRRRDIGHEKRNWLWLIFLFSPLIIITIIDFISMFFIKSAGESEKFGSAPQGLFGVRPGRKNDLIASARQDMKFDNALLKSQPRYGNMGLQNRYSRMEKLNAKRDRKY